MNYDDFLLQLLDDYQVARYSGDQTQIRDARRDLDKAFISRAELARFGFVYTNVDRSIYQIDMLKKDIHFREKPNLESLYLSKDAKLKLEQQKLKDIQEHTALLADYVEEKMSVICTEHWHDSDILKGFYKDKLGISDPNQHILESIPKDIKDKYVDTQFIHDMSEFIRSGASKAKDVRGQFNDFMVFDNDNYWAKGWIASDEDLAPLIPVLSEHRAKQSKT